MLNEDKKPDIGPSTCRYYEIAQRAVKERKIKKEREIGLMARTGLLIRASSNSVVPF